MTIVYIYGLFDPRNLQLRYIGKSIRPDKRFREHIKEANRNNDNIRKNNWIRQLLSENLEPSIEILEECTEDNWAECEKAWIKECREKGLNLTNLTEGGENPPKLNELPNSEEIKAKISRTRKKLGLRPPLYWKGKKLSEEHKRNQSKSIRAYYAENEHPSKGTNQTEDHKEKIKQAKIENGTWNKSPKDYLTEEEFKEMYKKRDTPEWRKNLSEKAKERFSNPKNNPMYGKKQTEKSKIKNRLSNLMYHANRKNQIDELYELQNQYHNVAGHYQKKYPQPA